MLKDRFDSGLTSIGTPYIVNVIYKRAQWSAKAESEAQEERG